MVISVRGKENLFWEESSELGFLSPRKQEPRLSWLRR